MATAASSLNFRIFHCSSQDPSFPVNELISLNKDPSAVKGWQSQRFCVYPQEIVLQFPCLVHLKQLQFLIHQNKIPSRIELFSYAPDFSAGNAAGALVSMSNPNLNFVRLGHFSLDDNIKTNYQARELKTVYLEQYCQYLKIVMHKNHQNSFNIFNQVGLISINCIGSFMGDYEVAMISSNPSAQIIMNGNMPVNKSLAFQGNFNQDPSLMPRNLKITSVQDQDLDPTLQDKIRALNSAKQKAVDNEDFDKAKSLKEVIDKLKIAGQQLIQLEIKKKLAIENEDFDTAKVLKYEIDRLRGLAMTLDTDRVILTPIINQRRVPQTIVPPGDNYNENFEDFRSQRPPAGYDQESQSAFEESKEEKINDRSFKIQNQNDYMSGDRSIPMSKAVPTRGQNGNSQQFGGPLGNEEMIVPAHNMKKPIDFNTVNEDDFDGQARNNYGEELVDPTQMRIQDIPQSQRPIADAMLNLFSEEIVLMVFAKGWQQREKGIQQVIDQVGSVLGKEGADGNVNSCMLNLITEYLKDKVQQITVKSFQLVEAYLKALDSNKQINPKQEPSTLEKMFIQILDKLADAKFSQKAEQAYLSFFAFEQLDGIYLVSFLMKQSSFLNKKLASSFKHQVPRLRVLNQVISDFEKYESRKKFTQQNFPWAQLFNKVKEGIEASQQDQRKISQDIICNIYSQFGFKRIEPLVTELTYKSLELLLKDIPEVETYMKMKKQMKKD